MVKAESVSVMVPKPEAVEKKEVKRFCFSLGPNQSVFLASEYRNPDSDPRSA